MSWQPIETYDKLKNKPKWAVFYVAEKESPRAYCGLSETLSLSRVFGNREVTHWMKLPPSPVVES